jgi:hypothetical protein
MSFIATQQFQSALRSVCKIAGGALTMYGSTTSDWKPIAFGVVSALIGLVASGYTHSA